MSVVDAPPGHDFAGPAAGEFVARSAPRKLAKAALALCIIDAIASMALARRKLHAPGTSLLFVGPMMCICIAGVGAAVRSARVRLETGCVSWGWGALRFRMPKSKIEVLELYESSLAVRAKRGSTWFLSRHDWADFETISDAIAKANLPFAKKSGRAPFRSRMQGYGIVLDLMMVFTMLGSLALVAFAALR